MASVKNMSAQVDKYIWVLSIICCLNQALWVNGEPIPLVGVETCAARDGCSQNCPTNHTCCACARCTDDGFPFARSFCFCCPPDHLCCAQTHRGSNPTCCPSGTMCGESNGVSMCITPFTPETRQADWTKLIPTYCTSLDSETSSTNDDDLTTPSRDVTMETSVTEHSSEGTDSTVLGTENPPLNSEPHESTADRDDSEGTTKSTTTESDNSESLTNLSDSSHVPEITTGSEIDLRTTNPDDDQSSLNPSFTSELISNSQESHTQTSSDGSTTDNLEEKNTTVITEITSDKADEPTSTQEPNSSNTSEAFDTRTVSDKTKTDEEPGSSVTTVTGIEESKTSESMINGTTSGRPE